MKTKTNRTWLIQPTKNNWEDVTDILSEPILKILKKHILLKQMETDDKGVYSLDFIADKLTTKNIVDLLASGVVIERIKYFVEINPTLANVDTPDMFPNREIAAIKNEEGKITTSAKMLKINEYFWNQTVGGRFFIRLAKTPIDKHLNIDSNELPNSDQVKQFIKDHSKHIIGYYSQMEYNELMSKLNNKK